MWNETPEKRPRTHTSLTLMHSQCVRRRPTLVKMSRAPRRTMINFNFSFFSGWIPFRSVGRSAVCWMPVSPSNIIVITDYFINFGPHRILRRIVVGERTFPYLDYIMICWWPIECTHHWRWIRSGSTMLHQHRIEPRLNSIWMPRWWQWWVFPVPAVFILYNELCTYRTACSHRSYASKRNNIR